MSRYWHFLITHSLKRQGSHEQDERKINARWMLKVISDAPNRTESRSPRFCAQGIWCWNYGVSGNCVQNQILISMRILTTACILSTNLCSKMSWKCSKSSWTRRTVQSRAALGFVHKGSGVMGFLLNLLRISWWFHEKGPYILALS